mmetsp:Transcript_27128/g.75826  ORF Transcript_27128/g.75826 Transcript_27128/m.75826 type:complete len:580 (+) Transcript_27128:96-1835(+)
MSADDMQNANRGMPEGDPMSAEVQERWDTMTHHLHSWIDENKIREVIEKGHPRIYWGTATTGKPHLGYMVPIYKISDFLRAGCEVTILFANLHGFLDNMKSTWEVLNLRMEFYEIVIKALLEFIGVPLDKLKFVRGTDFQLSREYTLDVYRMAASVTTEHTTRAGAEVVKQVANPLMSNLLYPILQALDEEYLNVDIQFGGVDQRKIFMFSRDRLHNVNYRKRAYLMNPLIPGLGESGKMSSSEPNSKIDFDDSDADVKRKIMKAFSVDGKVDGNGLLAICKYIIFRKIETEKREFVAPRPDKYGGPLLFKTYEELEKAFRLPEDDPNKLRSGELKRGMIAELSVLIGHMRDLIAKHQDLHDKAYPHLKEQRGAHKGKGQALAGKGAGKGKQAQPGQKKGKGSAAPVLAEPQYLDFRVGHVVSVEPHPSSDTLYVEKIDVGEEQPRQIVSGLAEHISVEDFTGRKVMVFCNLKPSNFRAVRSEGMVMCSSKDKVVEVLTAPDGSNAGDRITIGELEMAPVSVIDPKKKNNIWNGEKAEPSRLQPHLMVNAEGVAVFKDLSLHVGGKPVTSATLRNAPIS